VPAPLLACCRPPGLALGPHGPTQRQDRLAAELRQVDITDPDSEALVAMYARQTAVLARLAGKMRLVPPRGNDLPAC
jgi:hypothetical protein